MSEEEKSEAMRALAIQIIKTIESDTKDKAIGIGACVTVLVGLWHLDGNPIDKLLHCIQGTWDILVDKDQR